MISDPYAAGYTFARSAFTGGPTRDQKAVRTIYIYRTGRFIGEDFILAIGDLFNFSPIFKTPTKYIRYY